MIVGLDIGGANLKAADSNGTARSVPFALWKAPERLPHMLHDLLASMPATDVLAVTMTGELCDCFASKDEGVLAILDAVKIAAQKTKVIVWTNQGQFVYMDQARRQTHQVAAANWLALASCAAKLTNGEPGLLIDVGSTTTDIVPLLAGVPQPRGFTDPERLQSRELVYCGVRRTPLCALLGLTAAAEFFATTLDVYLILDFIAEDAHDRDTADGRPATRAAAHSRLAHMLCGDAATISAAQTRSLAEQALRVQMDCLAQTVDHVAENMALQRGVVVLAGAGEFLARRVMMQAKIRPQRIVSLSEKWGPVLSQAACAYAVAQLAEVEISASLPRKREE
jgi:probable H4MPT-linked C1 transfer pathway protein